VSFSILVVVDEPDLPERFRQHLRRGVRDSGYLLHFATSGEDGLRHIAEIGPELIVTAYADDGRRQRATELGAAAFLAKPIDFAALKVRLVDLVHGVAGR
jgi:CheY-like chemotaxis protein